MEDESLEVLSAGLVGDDRLPRATEDLLASLAVLDDESLRKAARASLPVESSESLEELHIKNQREGLTEAEEYARARLMEQYEHHVLVRAQAAALLKQRAISAIGSPTT